MSVVINYNSNLPKKNSGNIILFTDEKYNISNLKKYISKNEYSFLSDLIKTKDSKEKIHSFDFNSKKKIILVSLKKDISSTDVETLGANFYDLFKNFKQNEYCLNSDSLSSNTKNLIGYFLHGLKLKSYKFEKYKTKKK